MSPFVESVSSSEHIPGIKWFSIDLANDTPFDADKFDQQIEQVSDPLVEGLWRLKYIVQNDIMFVFDAGFNHDAFRDHLPSGSVQSAGMISVTDYGDGNEREIHGVSARLAQERKIDVDESNRYRIHVILPKLGEFFAISE